MKLKEQRENLKAQGNKHEDNIMKENAKLQVGWFFLVPFLSNLLNSRKKLSIGLPT